LPTKYPKLDNICFQAPTLLENVKLLI